MAEMMRQQINLAIAGEEGASLSSTESITGYQQQRNQHGNGSGSQAGT